MLTRDELAALVMARATDVELNLTSSTGTRSWVPARLTGHTRGRSGVHVEVRRVDGSIMAFTYPIGQACVMIRRAPHPTSILTATTSTPEGSPR